MTALVHFEARISTRANFEMTAIPGTCCKFKLRSHLPIHPHGASLCGFRGIFLKIFVKSTPEAMVKFLEIHASFLILCIVASCWVSMKSNLRRRLWRNFFRTSLCGFLCNSLEDLS